MVCLKAWNLSLSFRFTEDLTVASSAYLDSIVLVEEGLGSIWNNLRWMLISDFLPFFISCLKAMDPIFLVFLLAAMFTLFKVFDMVSIPDMPLRCFLLLGS